jgi:hypothetical protein
MWENGLSKSPHQHQHRRQEDIVAIRWTEALQILLQFSHGSVLMLKRGSDEVACVSDIGRLSGELETGRCEQRTHEKIAV